MQASCRLVQNVKRLSSVAFRQFGGQFHPLRLAPRNGRRRLAKCQISQPHILQCFDLFDDLRNALKEFHSLVDGHVQHIADRFALVAHLQRFAVVALAVALVAMHIHVGQKIHFNQFHAATLALLASATFYVERETSRFVTPDLRFGQNGKQVADVAENPGIRGGVRAGCASNGRLVYLHHFIDVLKALKAFVRKRILHRFVEMLAQDGLKRFVDQR